MQVEGRGNDVLRLGRTVDVVIIEALSRVVMTASLPATLQSKTAAALPRQGVRIAGAGNNLSLLRVDIFWGHQELCICSTQSAMSVLRESESVRPESSACSRFTKPKKHPRA